MNSRTLSGKADVGGIPLRIGTMASTLWLVTALAGAAAACCLATSSQAATRSKPRAASPSAPSTDKGPWSTQRFVYKAEGKRLSEVLQDFAASQGMPVVIGDGVDGVVHASFDSTPQDFLNAINKTFGVIWYHDGTTVYFYPSRAMQSKLFRLKGFSRAQVVDMLASLHVGDKRFPLRYNEAESTLLVYGPPRHIELVTAALESLDAGATERNQMMVRVFPLRYASAGDRSLGSTTIPGLVNTLRAIYGGGDQSAIADLDPIGLSTPTRAPSLAKAQAMQGAYGASLMPDVKGSRDGGSAPAQDKPGAEPARGVRSPVNLEDDQPTFTADEGTNSIIVHGRLRRMAEYGYLINRLDVRPALIELEATIIDVNADNVDQLGIDWSFTSGKAQVSLTSPVPGAGDPTSNGPLTGAFSVSTLWTNAGRELLSRVTAMQAKGEARVIAKPKVLGVVNRAATMKENQVVSVRVAGNLEANLFQIEAGTLLQVTPQLHLVDGTANFKLSLYIEDGSFETSQVDNVPVVKHTQIRTEAQVVEGESLLIGGITVDSQLNDNAGVPGLSKIPLLGRLFRRDDSHTSRSERMFLITPKLVRDIDHLPPPAENQFEANETVGTSQAPVQPRRASAPTQAARTAPSSSSRAAAGPAR